MRLLRRLRYLLRRDSLAEEIELHRAMLEDAQRAEGLSAEESRAAARRTMGNATAAAEDSRQVWLASWFESVLQDVRYAVRSLRSQPGFTGMALVALVLGIGLNTSLFTVINAALFRPWDVPEADRMVKLHLIHPRLGSTGFSVAAARHLNESSRTLEGAFVFRTQPVSLDDAGERQQSTAFFTSGNYFDVLRVTMAIGRPFSPRDDVAGVAPVAVLSYGLWSQRYGADPGILGREVRIDGVPFTVIGVADRKFVGTSTGRTDLWAPLASLALARPNDPSIAAFLTSPAHCCSEVAGRLASSASLEQAQAELNALFHAYAPPELFEQFQQAAPDVRPEAFDIVLTGTALLSDPDQRQRAAPIMALLLAAVGSILLLACANVSNLLLARASARQKEIAVRVAIGAARNRVIRQLLTESLLLATLASAGALLLAFELPRLVLLAIGEEAPANLRLTPDLTVLGYSIGLAFVAALAFGLAPALRGTRVAVSDAMKRQAAHASPRFPLRGVLLGAQVAVSAMLLVGAGLLLRALDKARAADPGFRMEGITAIEVRLPANGYDRDGQRAFFGDLLRQMQPAGQRVGATALVPLGRSSNWGTFHPSGQGNDHPSMLAYSVNAEFFDALGIPIVAGRNFGPGDRAGSAILVNESLARLYWPGQSAVGQTANIGRSTVQIVGVVRDAQLRRLGPPEPAFFGPFEGGSGSVLLVPSAFAPQVAATVRRIDSRAVTQATPLSQRFYEALGDSRGAAQIAGALGVLALLLATVGVYGVISYSVEQRRREIGIRMALGARPSEVVGMILRRNARSVLGGLVVGLLLAAGASVILQNEFYGTNALDPAAWGGVLVLLALAGVAASVVPARRAAHTDPVTALHHE